MSTVTVETFLIDEENEEKFWAHGIRRTQVVQRLDGPHSIKKNRKQRRASHLLVGRDGQGNCIAVPIEPTHDRTVWRPVTAWYCKSNDAEWLD